jgi:FtsH-binding integral membrane protein
VATQFVSRLSPWMYLLMIVSFLVYAIVAWATRKVVVANGWPFCSRCRIVRALRFLTAAAVFAAGIVAILVAASPMSTRTQLSLTEGLVLVTGLVLFLVGIIAMTRSGWASVARATVTRDGIWVSVRKAHPRFDAQVSR